MEDPDVLVDLREPHQGLTGYQLKQWFRKGNSGNPTLMNTTVLKYSIIYEIRLEVTR